MRGLEKNCMKRDKHKNTQTDGHRDSMKESAKGRFFEKRDLIPTMVNSNLTETIPGP